MKAAAQADRNQAAFTPLRFTSLLRRPLHDVANPGSNAAPFEAPPVQWSHPCAPCSPQESPPQ